MDELDVLKLVAARLEAAGIPYMVTGSMAMALYGQPRMTRDLDLVVELDEPAADRVVRMFERDFVIDADMARAAARSRGMFNMIHAEAVIKVDVIVRKDEPYRREEFLRRCPAEFGGQRIWAVTPEDLILSKLAWASASRSEQQLRDVRTLLGAGRPLDVAYIGERVAGLGVADLWREVRPQ
jgi:hypothetical protein